jgi:hypothetical protein
MMMPTRRHFLAGLAGFSASILTRRRTFAATTTIPSTDNSALPIDRLLGGLKIETTASPLTGGVWYSAENVGDGFHFKLPPGGLSISQWLSMDLLAEGFYLLVFMLSLQEGEDGPKMDFQFGALAECQARLRMPLTAVSQNQWLYEREGALLKPMAWGDRVELSRVDRLTIKVYRKIEGPLRFCMTPLRLTAAEPARLTAPLLPKGVLLDELGQSSLRNWDGKTQSADELTSILRSQLTAATDAKWPDAFSQWGGMSAKSAPDLGPPTGFFRVQHDAKRWWLADPDGRPFWSAGVDSVGHDVGTKIDGIESALAWLPPRDGQYAAAFGRRGPSNFNTLAANLIRAFGPNDWETNWGKIALSHLRRIGFNTAGNWSEWRIASAAGIPYVRPLQFEARSLKLVYREFPDVFAPEFPAPAARYAEQLRETATDPALIGYFLMNEPHWGFANQTPADGMLFNTESCACRDELAKHLKNRYADDAALAAAWNMPVTFDQLARGRWSAVLSDPAKTDLRDFSTVMVDRLFHVLTDACRKVDPNHMNLGARYYTVPPEWALAGMKRFDVFSMNCYARQVPGKDLDHIATVTGRPTLIGEFHFGALDVGLPASGIGRVKDQAARGQAYRFYVEQAAADPNCVGVNYFTLYDESALGRFDGENYNIGFLDVCNRPYEPLAKAARETHERLYQVAAGEIAPISDAAEYLTKLFC